MAEMTATAIARETGETVIDARKRIWLRDSQVRAGLQVPALYVSQFRLTE